MSTDCLSQPLSIQAIASQYTLPTVIRSALGFRGSSRPIILHSISNITFAFGRALTVHKSKKNDYQFFRPIDSEIVAIPLEYPGYFECLLPSSPGPEDGVMPEKSFGPIVERMRINYRSQTFYIVIPLHVYTLETKSDGNQNRLWHKIDPHQLIVIDQITNVEYTPTENDNLTPEDYGPWWFCLSKHILNRNEQVMKCFLPNQQICYIPCSSTDEICLYPVGQRGSTNVYKLHTIQNLLEQFPLPINIKLAKFPGCETYKDFNGHLRLVGSYTQEFAVCASLSSTNISFIPVKNSMKFIVTPMPLTSPEIVNQLLGCQMFIKSFNMQIRRILISSPETSSHRSRSRTQSTTNGKRSTNVDEQDEQIISTKDDHRSGSSVEKKPITFRKVRAISTGGDNSKSRKAFKRTLSTDNNAIYNSLIYPIQTKSLLKQSPSPSPSTSSKKSPDAPHSSTSFTYDTGSNLINDIDLPNANGAILLDDSNELFPPVKINKRSS